MTIDKEITKRVEQLVDEAAEEYDEFPQEICDELNNITGNDWSGEEYLEYCAGYWESPWSLEEVVYALLNNGEFPQRKIENLYAWVPVQIDMAEEDIISFFRYGKYKDNISKTNLFIDIDKNSLFDELQNEFTEWKCDERRLSKSNNTSFYSTKNDRYGYEKIIDINAGYESKFINITLKNMDDDEKNRFISIINKWAGAIVQV